MNELRRIPAGRLRSRRTRIISLVAVALTVGAWSLSAAADQARPAGRATAAAKAAATPAPAKAAATPAPAKAPAKAAPQGLRSMSVRWQ